MSRPNTQINIKLPTHTAARLNQKFTESKARFVNDEIPKGQNKETFSKRTEAEIETIKKDLSQFIESIFARCITENTNKIGSIINENDLCYVFFRDGRKRSTGDTPLVETGRSGKRNILGSVFGMYTRLYKIVKETAFFTSNFYNQLGKEINRLNEISRAHKINAPRNQEILLEQEARLVLSKIAGVMLEPYLAIYKQQKIQNPDAQPNINDVVDLIFNYMYVNSIESGVTDGLRYDYAFHKGILEILRIDQVVSEEQMKALSDIFLWEKTIDSKSRLEMYRESALIQTQDRKSGAMAPTTQTKLKPNQLNTEEKAVKELFELITPKEYIARAKQNNLLQTPQNRKSIFNTLMRRDPNTAIYQKLDQVLRGDKGKILFTKYFVEELDNFVRENANNIKNGNEEGLLKLHSNLLETLHEKQVKRTALESKTDNVAETPNSETKVRESRALAPKTTDQQIS